jgi:phosphoserine aminotransferase
VSSSIISAQSSKRAFNFNAGPAALPLPVLERIREELLDWRGTGMSVGLIFAGAQKNLGPSGATVVIVRKELAERAGKNLPTVLQYRTHIKERSLYHTPPTFAIYIIGLVMEWSDAQGGVAAIEKRNEAKAKLLYDAIDSSGGYYTCPVEKSSRSKMNVVFRVSGGVDRFAVAQDNVAIVPSAACAYRSTTPSPSKPSKPSSASCANSAAPAARTAQTARFRPSALKAWPVLGHIPGSRLLGSPI